MTLTLYRYLYSLLSSMTQHLLQPVAHWRVDEHERIARSVSPSRVVAQLDSARGVFHDSHYRRCVSTLRVKALLQTAGVLLSESHERETVRATQMSRR